MSSGAGAQELELRSLSSRTRSVAGLGQRTKTRSVAGLGQRTKTRSVAGLGQDPSKKT